MIIRPYPNFGESGSNPGDLIVELGALNKIKEIESSPDVYLVGTPWFWHKAYPSPKYDWLEYQLDKHKERQVHAVSVGAYGPLDKDYKFILEDGQSEAYKRIWSRFTSITVRDEEAHKLLAELGIESKLEPCLSSYACNMWAVDFRPQSYLIVDAPQWDQGVSKIDIDHLKKQLNSEDVSVYDYSRGSYTKDDIYRLFAFLLQHNTIISARVHCAIPMLKWRNTYILPVDMRWKTAQNCGIKPWPNIKYE